MALASVLLLKFGIVGLLDRCSRQIAQPSHSTRQISVTYQGWDASRTVLAGQQFWSRGARGSYRRALSSAGGRSPRTGAQRRLAARSLGGLLVSCLRNCGAY